MLLIRKRMLQEKASIQISEVETTVQGRIGGIQGCDGKAFPGNRQTMWSALRSECKEQPMV